MLMFSFQIFLQLSYTKRIKNNEQFLTNVYAPEIEDIRHIVIVLSVIP